MVFRGNFSGPVSATDLVKSSKDLESLVVCNEIKFVCWGCRLFVSDVIIGRLLGHHDPWPTSPGPGPKPLDGSISLHFFGN